MDDHYYFEKSIFLSSGWLCVYIISGQIIIFHLPELKPFGDDLPYEP
jgi:hypothetical protein